jgi:hypothetical protein
MVGGEKMEGGMGYAMRVTRCVTIVAVFASLVLLASTGSAERPQTAASSAGICGVLSDATPGLESLCVNYCERRDCPNSDEPECDNLLINYDRHRRDGDPEMPCLWTCPCFTAQEVRDHPAELTRCIQYASADFFFRAIFAEDGVSGAGSTSNWWMGSHDCLYADFTVDPPIVRFGGLALEPEEAAVCQAVIDAEIFDRGLTCEPWN